MKKATNAEASQRTRAVYEKLVQGASRAEILQYVAKEAWGINERSIDYYIQRATKKLEKEAAPAREIELGKAKARLAMLFARSLQIKDYKGALAIQKEINTLLGLNAPARQEHTGKDGGPLDIVIKGYVNVSPDDL